MNVEHDAGQGDSCFGMIKVGGDGLFEAFNRERLFALREGEESFLIITVSWDSVFRGALTNLSEHIRFSVAISIN